MNQPHHPPFFAFILALILLSSSPTMSAAHAQTATPPTPLHVDSAEPARIEQSAGGYLTVYGSGFTEGSVIRLYGYGVLDTTYINAETLRAYVPAGISRGSHDLQVIRPDGEKAYLGNAVIIHAPKAPTATPKPPLLLFNQPELVIEQVSSEPQSLRPGQPFRLHLRLHNRGDYTAANIRLSLSDTSLAVPQQGSNLYVLERLDYGQTITITLPLALRENAPNGYQGLPIDIAYNDLIGREYTSQQSIGLQIRAALGEQPRVLLETYSSTPQDLSPGVRFNLSLALHNAGSATARQVVATLGGQDGASLQPFALLGSGNVRYLGEIVPGGKINLHLEMLIAGDAKPGAYTLPVLLNYSSPEGQAYQETQALTLLLKQPPQLQLSLNAPLPTVQPGETVDISAEIVNIGRAQINVSTIEVRGQGFDVLSGQSIYWGPIDGGSSASLDASIQPQQSGRLTVEVAVHYLDDFNQPQEVVFPLQVQVTPPQPIPTPPQDSNQPAGQSSASLGEKILQFFKALLGLGS